MRNRPYGFEIYLVNVKTIRTIAQIFVAFSEKLNFTCILETSIEPCFVRLKKWNALIDSFGPFCVSDQAWVTLDRIQFVGACNPPTDPGRKPLAHRFLRHVPVRYLTKL